MLDASERITLNPLISGGRPCIRGMRMRVSDLLELFADGATADEVLRDYPYLEENDLIAVLRYAARKLKNPMAPV